MSNCDPNDLIAPNDENFDYLFKIVLIGDCSTGKTCVVQRFRSGTFIERHGTTIGVDFSMKTVLVDGKRVKVSDRRYYLQYNHRIRVCVKYKYYSDVIIPKLFP